MPSDPRDRLGPTALPPAADGWRGKAGLRPAGIANNPGDPSIHPSCLQGKGMNAADASVLHHDGAVSVLSMTCNIPNTELLACLLACCLLKSHAPRAFCFLGPAAQLEPEQGAKLRGGAAGDFGRGMVALGVRSNGHPKWARIEESRFSSARRKRPVARLERA